MSFIAEKELSTLSLKELIALCESLHIDSSSAENRAELVSLIQKHKQSSAPSSSQPNTHFTNTIVVGHARSKPITIQLDPPSSSPSSSTTTISGTSPTSNSGRTVSPSATDSTPTDPSVYRFSIKSTVPVESSKEKQFTVSNCTLQSPQFINHPLKAYVVDYTIFDETKTILKRYRQFDELHEFVSGASTS
jgi:hypothetical protein